MQSHIFFFHERIFTIQINNSTTNILFSLVSGYSFKTRQLGRRMCLHYTKLNKHSSKTRTHHGGLKNSGCGTYTCNGMRLHNMLLHLYMIRFFFSILLQMANCFLDFRMFRSQIAPQENTEISPHYSKAPSP